MPTDKRQRQREGREARRQAALRAQKRAAKRRQIISILLLAFVIAGIGLVLSRGGDDEAGAKKAGDATSTTVDGDPSSTTSPQPTGDAECPPAGGSAERRTSFTGLPPMCIDPARSYKATVQTDTGTFDIALDAKKAPIAVNSFVFLSRYHYYDSVPFHRVIPGFVVQGGDGQRGDGTGGPGYKLKDELPAPREYRIGSVAMANSGPDTAGSQFFIVTGDQGVALPPSYTLFGMVTDGIDVVKKIEADGTPSGTPKVKHTITKVTITES